MAWNCSTNCRVRLWEGDIDAALNFAVALPTEGPASLVDKNEGVPVFRATETAAE